MPWPVSLSDVHGERKLNAKFRSSTRGVSGADHAPVQLDNPAGHSKPEASARSAGREKRLEDPVLLTGGEAGPVIPNRVHQAIVFEGDCAFRWVRSRFRLHGIAHNVGQDLTT